MTLSRRSFFLGCASAAQALASPALAREPELYLESGLALSGYDPVAYFTEGRPMQGSANLEADWNGAIWRFANTDNKLAFLENPEKYAPQYGGYCAYAVGNGYTASADPQAWSITDGKLYVNYNKAVRGLWNLRRSHYIREGDKNWPSVLNS